jgi:hypothetical protein
VELPPLDGLISANATFRVWITETILEYRMKNNDATNGEWEIEPFSLTERLNFGKVGSFTHNMIFTPKEDNKLTYLKSSLWLWNSFRTEYLMTWTTKSVFTLNTTTGNYEWKKEAGDNELIPKDLTFSYIRTFPNTKLFKNYINLSYNINTSLNFDLQQHTNSNFQFTMALNMNIKNFLDVTLSATSQNSVIFRYFKNVPGMEDLTFMYPAGDQNNIFIDLFDSFNFFDETKRKRSGFKMQRFKLTLDHLLGDWTASFEISMYPYTRPASLGEIPTINVVSDISFFVKWKPITEIKSEIKYDATKDRWTRK